MGRHMALDKQQAFFRIDAAGDILGQHFQRLTTKSRRFLTHSDGMEIHHAEDAPVFLLQSHPVAHGPQVIAQGQLARGLHAAEHRFGPGSLLCFGFLFLFYFFFYHFFTS